MIPSSDNMIIEADERKQNQGNSKVWQISSQEIDNPQLRVCLENYASFVHYSLPILTKMSDIWVKDFRNPWLTNAVKSNSTVNPKAPSLVHHKVAIEFLH